MGPRKHEHATATRNPRLDAADRRHLGAEGSTRSLVAAAAQPAVAFVRSRVVERGAGVDVLVDEPRPLLVSTGILKAPPGRTARSLDRQGNPQRWPAPAGGWSLSRTWAKTVAPTGYGFPDVRRT